MNQEDLAIALDKSPSVISALVNNVKGKAAAGKKLKKKALDYLHAHAKGSESVVQGRSESELSGVEHSTKQLENKTAAEWKSETIRLRRENAVLRATVHVLTDPSAPVNSVSTERILLELGKLSQIQTRDRQTGESGQKSGS